MIKDDVRTGTYRNAMLMNPELFKDKIVLDVGCGTGILSMFAAQAGAKAVYGVEFSSIADKAKQIVEENGFSNRVTIIKGKIEEIELPVAKVDIIVSEWMGYCLLYENMLECVIYARDKWLAPGGILLPNKATMTIVGIEDYDYRSTKIDFWDNVYGFKMSCLKADALVEPLVDICPCNQMITTSADLVTLNIETVKKEDLAFKSTFSLSLTHTNVLHAVVIFFEINFTHGKKQYTISTAPWARYTHWKHTVFYVPVPMDVQRGNVLNGVFDLRPSTVNPREMDIDMEFYLYKDQRDADGEYRKWKDVPVQKSRRLSGQSMQYKLR